MDNEIVVKNEGFLKSVVDDKNGVLVERVSSMLGEINNQTRIFDRSNSQSTISHMTMTMLNGQSPMRMLRQSLAEIERREMALYEAQYNQAKTQADIDVLNTLESLTAVQKAEKIKLEHSLKTINNKVNGALKDISILLDTYESIKAKNDIDEWSEEDFENAENKHHIRRGFELLYRNILEIGRPKDSTLEYLQQYGVHPQIAFAEVNGYVIVANKAIENKESLTSDHLEDFLDTMSEKYLSNVKNVDMRIYGKENIANKDYMSVIEHNK